MCAGWYTAIDLIGVKAVDYHSAVAGNPAINVLVTPWHECYGRINLPVHGDFNLFYCLTQTLAIEVDPNARSDYGTLHQNRSEQLIASALATCAITSALTTTFFYSFQLRGTHLQHHFWAGNNPAHIDDLLRLGLITRDENGAYAAIHYTVCKTFGDVCSFTRPIGQFNYRDWVSLPIELPNTNLPQADGLAIAPDWTYTWGNPLYVSRFLIRRPEEWGICLPRPICSFNKEVIVRGIVANASWRSLSGSEAYTRAAHNGAAYFIVPCGVYALNVICQWRVFSDPCYGILAMIPSCVSWRREAHPHSATQTTHC